jgi:chlorophyllide a reductase subunit Y
LAQVINTALANRARFIAMREFFDGVGTGETTGIWDQAPPSLRARPIAATATST